MKQFKHQYSYVNPDRVFTYLQDAGHGWFSVPIKYLQAVMSDAEIRNISPFSYTKGKSVYLEEDCDAGLFISAWKALIPEFKYEVKYTERSPVRSYSRVGKEFIEQVLEERNFI